MTASTADRLDARDKLLILSGGAAHGIVAALSAEFTEAAGLGVQGDFGAVGGMRKRLLNGERPDLVILTAAILKELGEAGVVERASIADVGAVPTSIAVRQGDAAPDAGSADALRKALADADAIYFPDPEQATAGIHFQSVLAGLGLLDEVRRKLRTHPNGAAAMGALAASADRRPIGCTQATEIVATPGVSLVCDLPEPHGLLTMYTAGVVRGSAKAAQARLFAQMLADGANAARRRACGFK
jgi:molybdate transport system substrate-binding protein